MAAGQSFLLAALTVVLLSIIPSYLNTVEAKLGFLGAEADVFVDKRTSLSPERRSAIHGDGLISRLVARDPCLNGAKLDNNGNPCKSPEASKLRRLSGTLRVGNHPPGVGGHNPNDLGRIVGHHPPGVGRHPPGVGHHPPGVGRHPPGVGKRCHKNHTRCLDPQYNPRILVDPTATTCCSKSCLSVINDWRACGGCGRSCGTSTDGIAHGCCDGQCVDLNNRDTCGGCFSCAPGEICSDGVCTTYQ